MKILSWNVRGLGNDRTFIALKKFFQLYRPQLIFLCETKLKTVRMNNVGRKLKMENCFAVSSKGKSGGLAMLWTLETNVNITSFSSHHINAEIVTENGDQMRCTGIYSHPETNQKKHTWTLLRRLASLSSSPWLCFGDFNEIMHFNEKNGGNDRELSMITDFREAVQDCNLRDLGCNGYPFTWSNRRFGTHFIKEQLDRFMCSNDWSNFFQDQAATNLVTSCSDHNPILMAVKSKDK